MNKAFLEKSLGKKAVIPQAVLVSSGILILLAVVFFVVGQPGSSDGDGNKEKMNVKCDVEIRNLILKDARIETFSCTTIDSCLFSNTALSITDKGTLVMRMGSQEDKVRYKITEESRQSYELSLCTRERSGKILLFNENSQIIDQKEFTV